MKRTICTKLITSLLTISCLLWGFLFDTDASKINFSVYTCRVVFTSHLVEIIIKSSAPGGHMTSDETLSLIRDFVGKAAENKLKIFNNISEKMRSTIIIILVIKFYFQPKEICVVLYIYIYMYILSSFITDHNTHFNYMHGSHLKNKQQEFNELDYNL